MKLMLNCQEATLMMERKSAAGLGRWEGLLLKFHIGLCTACGRYAKQTTVIDKLLKTPQDVAPVQEGEESIADTEALKMKIMESLEKRRSK